MPGDDAHQLEKGHGISLASVFFAFFGRGALSIIFPHFHRFYNGVYRFSSICPVSSRFFLGFLIVRCFFNGFL